MKEIIMPQFTPDESQDVAYECNQLLAHYASPLRPYKKANCGPDSLWLNNMFRDWYFDDSDMATALNKVRYALWSTNHPAIPRNFITSTNQPYINNGQMHLPLSEAEFTHLTNIINRFLNEFSLSGYMGRHSQNPVFAKAFNKLYHTLTGKDHPNLHPDNYNKVLGITPFENSVQ